MPANHHINNQLKLIVTTWEGEVSDIELVEALKKYQAEIQNLPEYIHYNELLDFSHAAGIKLSTEGVKHIGELASSTDKDQVDRKLAIVVSSNLAFGLARMYEAYRGMLDRSRKEVRVFKNEKEAMNWINC